MKVKYILAIEKFQTGISTIEKTLIERFCSMAVIVNSKSYQYGDKLYFQL